MFFPVSDDPTLGTLLAFSTLSVGFLARPVGGVIAGHFGDKFGRKPMLVITLIVMGVATTLIGFLPTYEQVGVLASGERAPARSRSPSAWALQKNGTSVRDLERAAGSVLR